MLRPPCLAALMIAASLPALSQENQPAAPTRASLTLQSPVDRDTLMPELQGGRITFRWHPAPGATYYRVQISHSDSLFSLDHEFDVQDTVAYIALRTGPSTWDWNTDYYWKVTATFQDGAQASSPPWSFRIPAWDPNSPRVRIPKEIREISDAPVRLCFRFDVSGYIVEAGNRKPQSYYIHAIHYEVAADSTFRESRMFAADRMSVPPDGWHIRLEPGKTQFVRMYATFDYGNKTSGPSPTMRIATLPFLPEAPRITDVPRDAAAPRANIQASKLPWAESTLVQIALDPGFTQIHQATYFPNTFADDQVILKSLNSTVLADDLDPGTSYYCRARGESGNSQTDWSPTATFRTNSQSPAPIILSPPEGLAVNLPHVRLAWKSPKSVKKTFVTVNGGGTPRLVNAEFKPTDSITLGGLKETTKYEVIVVADFGGTAPTATSRRSFSTPLGFRADPYWNGKVIPIAKGNTWKYLTVYEFQYGTLLSSGRRIDSTKYDSSFITFQVDEVHSKGDSLTFTVSAQESTFVKRSLTVNAVQGRKHTFMHATVDGMTRLFGYDQTLKAWILMNDWSNQGSITSPATRNNFWKASDGLFFDPVILSRTTSTWTAFEGRTLGRFQDYPWFWFTHDWLRIDPGRLQWKMIEGIGVIEVVPVVVVAESKSVGGNSSRYSSFMKLLSFNGREYDMSMFPETSPPADWRPLSKREQAPGHARAPISWLTHLRQTDWKEAVVFTLTGKQVLVLRPGVEIRPEAIPPGLHFLRVRGPGSVRTFKVFR